MDVVVGFNSAEMAGNQQLSRQGSRFSSDEPELAQGDWNANNLGFSVVKNLVAGMGGMLLSNSTHMETSINGYDSVTLRFPVVAPD